MEKAFSPINLDNIGLTISKLSDEDLKPILLFPSEMYHGVYPFYTSDDYRISVSGNFNFKI